MTKANRAKAYRRTNTFGVILIALIAVAVAVCMLIGCKNLKEKNTAYANQIVELNQNIAKESERAEEIEDYSKYVNSDEFIEKSAHDKFGLVGEDEIVVKPEE